MSVVVQKWSRTDAATKDLQKLLKCLVCDQIVHELQVLKWCGHFFCQSCMTGVAGEVCPQCGIPNHVKDVVPSRKLATMVSLCRKLRRITQGTSEIESHADNDENKGGDYLQTQPEASVQPPILTPHIDNQQMSSPVASSTSGKKTTRASSNKVRKESLKAKGAKPYSRTSKGFQSPASTSARKTSGLSNTSMSPASTPAKAGRLSRFGRQSPACTPAKTGGLSRSGRQSPACTPAKTGGLSRSGRQSPSVTNSPFSIEKRNAKGETPLHVATIKGDISRLKDLLSLGGNPNVKDNAGWTPLHEAVNHGYTEIARLLLDHGALINTPGPDNDTPLHDAVQCNQVECVKLLVSRGAGIEQRNIHGYTPLDMSKTVEMKTVLKTTPVESVGLLETSLSSTPVVKATRVVLLGTGLRRDQKSMLSKCASLLHGTCTNELSNEVTHVISCTNDEGMCPRTLKYLQAILTGKWILRFEWVEQCLSYGQSVCEEAFEVPGSSTSPDSLAPMKGRENVAKQLPGLFDGFQFYFHGTFKYPTPSKDELSDLIKLGGGKILSREPKQEALDDLEVTVPYHAKNNDALKDCGFLIVHDPNDKKMKRVRSSRLCSVPATWVMDCVAYFDILDLPK